MQIKYGSSNYKKQTEENNTNINLKKKKRKQKIIKSTLNRKATPCVPKQLKHKYNSKGELRQPIKKKSIKHNKHTPKPQPIKSTDDNNNNNNKHTFSSLYSPNPTNNNSNIKSDSFLFDMAKTIHPSILTVSEDDDASPSEDEDEFNDQLSLMYHVPDGILSSPKPIKTSNNNNNSNDYHYHRILKPYPMNYSTTPSPKQNIQNIVSPNGFGIDSPPRKNQKNKSNNIKS